MIDNVEGYPLVAKVISGISLLIPEEEGTRQVYGQRQAADGDMAFPFWARIWPSATVMTDFIRQHPEWIGNRSVLELGAGLALPSFAASAFAKEVLATDRDIAAVHLIRENISRLNLPNIRAEVLDWNHLPADISQDIVICSDINYDPRDFPGLLLLLTGLLEKGKTILLSTPQRIMAKTFISELEPYVQQHFTTEIRRGEELVFISLFVLRSAGVQI